ncbi:hypothetical protein J6590_090019 [Homalodisca vitripennis]|nr:hypothetical protein J6590_090019 [Homalodisca vitripennis]
MTHPDILVLTEHGLDLTTIKRTKLMDYNLVSAYGRDYHQKGGVAIYKSEKLDNRVESFNIEGHNEELICEMAGIKLLSDKDLPLLILGIYHPPSTPILDALALIGNALDTILCGDNSVVVIVGDLNANSLDPTNNNTIRLQEFLTSYDIHRLELPPTRLTTISIPSKIKKLSTSIHRHFNPLRIVKTARARALEYELIRITTQHPQCLHAYLPA